MMDSYQICNDCKMDTDDWVVEIRTTGDMGMGSGMYTWDKKPVHSNRKLCLQFKEIHNRVENLKDARRSVEYQLEEYLHAVEQRDQAYADLSKPL